MNFIHLQSSSGAPRYRSRQRRKIRRPGKLKDLVKRRAPVFLRHPSKRHLLGQKDPAAWHAWVAHNRNVGLGMSIQAIAEMTGSDVVHVHDEIEEAVRAVKWAARKGHLSDHVNPFVLREMGVIQDATAHLPAHLARKFIFK